MLSNSDYTSQDIVSAQQIDIFVVPSLFARIDLMKLRFFSWLNHWSANEIEKLVGEEIDEDFGDSLL